MNAPPASEIRQQSSGRSGSAMGLEAATSASVNGLRIWAFGCRLACRRLVTATAASCSGVLPNSCMWRRAISAYKAGIDAPEGASKYGWPTALKAASVWSRDCPVARFSPAHTSTVWQRAAAMASAPCPPLPSGPHRGRIPGREAEVFAQHRAEHEVRLGERVGGQQAVDVRYLQARVIERAPGRLGVQAQAAHVRHLADVGFADAHHGDLVLERHKPNSLAIKPRWICEVPPPTVQLRASRQ